MTSPDSTPEQPGREPDDNVYTALRTAAIAVVAAYDSEKPEALQERMAALDQLLCRLPA